jgi:hypothetical protein
MDLPDHPLPDVDTTLQYGSVGPGAKRPQHGLLEPHSFFVDSDWAACLRTR